MRNRPVLWVPTLYLAEGIPYTAVIVISVIFLKIKGLSVADTALYTSWLYLPWLIKPLWSPIVELLRRQRFLISVCQLLMGGAFASIALTIHTDAWLTYCMAALWLAAFMSATHDIAADGYYIDALSSTQQSAWVGLRSTFYKIAMLLCQGALVILAGYLEKEHGINIAWASTFGILAAMLAVLGIYHLVVLPKTEKENSSALRENTSIWQQLRSYFSKDNIGLILAFLLLFRLGESQLGKISALFMLDTQANGGLELDTEVIGLINGTFGLIAMSAGGIIGGLLIARQGLRKWIVPMVLALNVPDVFYLIMSWLDIRNVAAVSFMVSVEQLGYGFGFAAYSVFMLQISKGEYSTSHYSISTAFMAMGMMLPGMISGMLQETWGYTGFFVWVLACCVPSVAITIIARNRVLDKNKE